MVSDKISKPTCEGINEALQHRLLGDVLRLQDVAKVAALPAAGLARLPAWGSLIAGVRGELPGHLALSARVHGLGLKALARQGVKGQV